MDTVGTVALVVIAVLLVGVLTAVKNGFNQVIRGLEAIHEELGKRSP